jgi:methyl-accepting chemotaxis protein
MAISKSQAVIEFDMDGTIITANQNFLDTLGYRLEEIQGKHHSMFVAPAMRDGAEYRAFWANLNRGEYQAAEYKRIGKGGREVWIQASYNPIFDRHGKPYKIIKFATDITAQKIRSMEDAGKMAAIGRAQAVIEFNLDGTIITANDNFLSVLGYSLAEIQGKHHSMFVAPAERDGSAYRGFWASLNRGEFQSAEYKRFGKGGKEVWILASYNPILDDTGKPFKVVKFASDVTEQKLKTANFAGQIEAIGKSQAVIEFGMDGLILNANENFLSTLGYSLAEIQGKHHSMFVPPEERQSDAYRAFWASLNRGEFQAAEYGRLGKERPEGLDPGFLQSDPRSERQAL